MSSSHLAQFWRRLRPAPDALLDRMRLQIARPDALLWHALFGILTGLTTGVVIIGFRLAVEGTQALMLPHHGENYEALSIAARLLLPLGGALLIAAVFLRFSNGIRVLGVARVLERMEYHQGHLTLRGFVLQFVGAAVAIVSGHSVGREGPHVYLGASGGSLLGQLLELPNNSIRIMVACGTAAGIAASFNTPLAGVIFALEVLALEYSIATFIPIILAAASADWLFVSVFGANPFFEVPPAVVGSVADLMPVILLGIAAGMVSAAYTQAVQSIAGAAKALPFFWRLMLAGVIAGLCGALMPEVMGLGFDSLGQLLKEHLAWEFLLMLLAMKLMATSASIGLGIPGGTIGPALFMGAVIGNLTALVAAPFLDASAVPASFYVLLGMGAMMGASLLAPLAGLTAIVELTHSPGVIMPGMLAIIIAALVSYKGFGKDSLFITMLRANGLDYRINPLIRELRRQAVGGVMNRRFVHQLAELDRAKAERLVVDSPDWIIVNKADKPTYLMPGIAVATFLSQNPDAASVDLLEIPGERLELAPIHLQASLQEAVVALEATGAQALYVRRPLAPGIDHIYGVLTRSRIDTAYKY
ncbi:chloride channel protein [Thiorhodovibrio frisius]|uniref:Chloride channel protein EriC n=1 Tax=Thiorhodovibrio frisius TaxID=631362 RepID=H8Z083_9GAMM|nr:chloride channel protein [Thiorhodovibrio frisius]EIC22291.1 chloride channel protein EriC [Thiorhodovibrio frisius]WPL24585.1 H(+)/Cl(-) exchange transporter ClcA [Thiorhodovibrio frisius]